MDFFWSVSEFTNSLGEDTLGLVELLELTVDIDEVEEDTRALLSAELLTEVGLVTGAFSSFGLLHLLDNFFNSW